MRDEGQTGKSSAEQVTAPAATKKLYQEREFSRIPGSACRIEEALFTEDC